MPNHFRPLAVCVLMLAAVPLHADDAEEQAVKAVEKFGGTVIRDHTNPARPYSQVNLSSSKITDAELKALTGLKGLFYLNLFDTKVTDAGLKELAALSDLDMLELGYTSVTDAGLKNLAGSCSIILETGAAEEGAIG